MVVHDVGETEALFIIEKRFVSTNVDVAYFDINCRHAIWVWYGMFCILVRNHRMLAFQIMSRSTSPVLCAAFLLAYRKPENFQCSFMPCNSFRFTAFTSPTSPKIPE